LAFSKQPDIKDCEAAYSFLCCKDDICAVFNASKASLEKAYEELTALQVATNNAAMSSSTPTMNAEDAKMLSEKLKKMTKEEKKQWAMQNAKNFMPTTAVHVNKDIDNQPVNEAVKCVTDQQTKDIQKFNALTEFRSQLDAIEKNYKPKVEEVLKKFQAVTRTTYDPSSSMLYGLGEMNDEEAARFEKAVGEYKKTVLPIYNNEMKEKLNCVLQAEQALVPTYTPVEGKIASTHYGDDAQETVNKMHLYAGHINVLQKVKTYIGIFEEILSDYADQYAALMKIKSAKEVNNNKNYR
jgi:hypothetical protein